jgi:RimJ/RimL family protein N-acetyltransferase
MANLRFVRFTVEDFPLYRAWTEDPENAGWLEVATPQWRDYVLNTPNVFGWMVYDGERVVGSIQVDVVEDGLKAYLSCIVAPEHRRQGYGRRMLALLPHQPELQGVHLFSGTVQPANIASMRMVAAAGYTPTSPSPDEDGFVEVGYVRLV